MGLGVVGEGERAGRPRVRVLAGPLHPHFSILGPRCGPLGGGWYVSKVASPEVGSHCVLVTPAPPRAHMVRASPRCWRFMQHHPFWVPCKFPAHQGWFIPEVKPFWVLRLLPAVSQQPRWEKASSFGINAKTMFYILLRPSKWHQSGTVEGHAHK